jgi:cell division septation protein DedD
MSQRIFPIGPLSGASNAPAQQNATEPSATSPDNIPARSEEEHKKPIPLIWIPVVICLGLLVAAGYLGGRILASRPHESPPVGSTAAVAKPPASQNPVPQTPAVQNQAEITAVRPAVDNPAAADSSRRILTVRTHEDPTLVPPDDLSLIHPQPGDRYVQISALNTAAAHRYVEQLRHGPLEPHLSQGPTPTILRVLVGPFSSQASLLDTMTDLKAAGIECFIREY